MAAQTTPSFLKTQSFSNTPNPSKASPMSVSPKSTNTKDYSPMSTSPANNDKVYKQYTFINDLRPVEEECTQAMILLDPGFVRKIPKLALNKISHRHAMRSRSWTTFCRMERVITTLAGHSQAEDSGVKWRRHEDSRDFSDHKTGVSVVERSVNWGRFLVTRPGDIRSDNAYMSYGKSCEKHDRLLVEAPICLHNLKPSLFVCIASVRDAELKKQAPIFNPRLPPEKINLGTKVESCVCALVLNKSFPCISDGLDNKGGRLCRNSAGSENKCCTIFLDRVFVPMRVFTCKVFDVLATRKCITIAHTLGLRARNQSGGKPNT
ncbi:hypothetical protein RND71_019129 [Anisodus tanguticus]|uniref:Uncharacterized protein n=1 Tax=Anisodus tanguticus TaxID=243964 RepID=A0AAE1RYW0_9SOLA|nr:hypothetical protein RND71_019129 [Anisodus tanguticus]